MIDGIDDLRTDSNLVPDGHFLKVYKRHGSCIIDLRSQKHAAVTVCHQHQRTFLVDDVSVHQFVRVTSTGVARKTPVK
jgi:hypothetical protein